MIFFSTIFPIWLSTFLQKIHSTTTLLFQSRVQYQLIKTLVICQNFPTFCKEHLCDCNYCFQLGFENCTNEDAVHYDDNVDDNDSYCEEEINEEIDQSQQIFEFITVPSFVPLCTGTAIELLYFVQVTGKGVGEYDISGPYSRFIAKGEKYFQVLYLKLVRSRNPEIKRFSTLPTRIVIAPDEIYDTYVDFKDDLELDTVICKILIRKASC